MGKPEAGPKGSDRSGGKLSIEVGGAGAESDSRGRFGLAGIAGETRGLSKES